ncbi:MAG: PHP domain-containing protein [Dehalococcoidales bacterium]|nr:PHP domain-containing protein [Dehalococcoidales bacterium]MDP7286229.1 PHP domain-containing protein [Dehalococcoidales bacterium]MDP7415445.1 PHP domain-containing protein [Dehalococcoidales bacterium]
MSQIDLHIHSTVSDGCYRPEEIVRRAAALGLAVIALADHDSVDGITPALEAAKNFPRLKVLPCVEVSTDVDRGEVHILGYFIDCTSQKLKVALAGFRNSREGRAQGMIAKLAGLGIHITWPRVQEIAGGGSVGRPHIALAMLEKGYITSIKEAFDKYIARDGPAYVTREKITPAEAVTLVLQTNGLPVMAHPFTVPDPEVTITELKKTGLVGIEAYYNGYTNGEINSLVSLAKRLNLIVTGGTDYHGLDNSSEIMMGGIDVPASSVTRLTALAGQRKLKLANL